MVCQVCGAKESERHFGGESCRACAAFFRRYVHSRKMSIRCTCSARQDNSHPCRHCRMLKCLATGMVKNKVQATREKNKDICIPNTFSSISLLSCRIIPRDCSNIFCTVSNWSDLDKKREELYGENLFEMNFFELTTKMKSEGLMVWNLGEVVFPDLKKLNKTDKQAILCNFYPRWMMMCSAIDYCVNHDTFTKFLGSDAYYDALGRFYGTSIPEGQRMSKKETLKIFAPYWDWHYAEIADPIFKKKCDKVEYAAIFLLLLFDVAYSNISDECSKTLRNMRKVILRELKAYQTDNNHSEMRFIDTLDTLILLEKAEEKLHEEFLVCEMHNVTLHDDFKTIMQVKKL